MKNKRNCFLAFVALVITFLPSCQKDCGCVMPPTGINGEWIWIESVGGIGGWTLTPESEMITKRLYIDDFTFKEFVNDSLVFESDYDLEIRQDTFWDTNRYIMFESGGERAIKIGASELDMHEMCFDCFSHKYRRK
jgi:hypothetical protein